MRSNKTILSAFLALLLTWLLVPMAAMGAGNAVLELTYVYGQSATAVPGAAVALYRVGDLTAEGELRWSEGRIEAYRVTLDHTTAKDWDNAAETLAAYVRRDALRPDAVGRTDQTGRVRLAGLDPGLYLVVTDPVTVGSYTYRAKSFLVVLREGETVSASPKVDRVRNDSGSSTVKRTVQKVWKEDEGNVLRPAEIRVQLLRDGTVYDTRTLSESNGWSHTWTGLSDRYVWMVVEETVPQGYSVQTTTEGNGRTFVLTNTENPAEYDYYDYRVVTVNKSWDDNDDREGLRPASVKVQLYDSSQPYGDAVVLNEANGWTWTWTELPGERVWSVKELDVPAGYESTVVTKEEGFTIINSIKQTPKEDKPEEKTPDSPKTPEEKAPDSPKTPDTSTTKPKTDTTSKTTPSNKKSETLPQTGLLWWPVPVLVGGGLVLLTAGIARRRMD